MPFRVPQCRLSHLPSKAERDKQYQATRTDKEEQAFYNSTAWRKFRLIKLANDPLCEPCKARGVLVAANIVHHKKSVKTDPHLRLDMDNTESICKPCHSRLHAIEQKRK
jgi:5-methylcytosine-specific restriction enzyme A